jgi:hypothetical protein
MQLLAAVEGDGSGQLAETLVTGLSRLRRGMTAVIITPSLERNWVRPLASLRSRGVACVVVVVDAQSAMVASEPARRATATTTPGSAAWQADADARALAARALRHALAEHELRVNWVEARRPLAEALLG